LFVSELLLHGGLAHVAAGVLMLLFVVNYGLHVYRRWLAACRDARRTRAALIDPSGRLREQLFGAPGRSGRNAHRYDQRR
jgi:hypothetical protein